MRIPFLKGQCQYIKVVSMADLENHQWMLKVLTEKLDERLNICILSISTHK